MESTSSSTISVSKSAPPQEYNLYNRSCENLIIDNHILSSISISHFQESLVFFCLRGSLKNFYTNPFPWYRGWFCLTWRHIRIVRNMNHSQANMHTWGSSLHSHVKCTKFYGSEDQGSIPDRDKRYLSYPQRPHWPWNLLTLLSNGCRGSFPGVKRPGCEADRSSTSRAELKSAYLSSLLNHKDVDAGDVADVSEVRVTSIFRTKLCKLARFILAVHGPCCASLYIYFRQPLLGPVPKCRFIRPIGSRWPQIRVSANLPLHIEIFPDVLEGSVLGLRFSLFWLTTYAMQLTILCIYVLLMV
jgi:hypothetical protein